MEKSMDIVALNGDAVFRMRQGNYQEAISIFRTALRELLPRAALLPKADLGEILCRVLEVGLTVKVTCSFLSVRSVPLEHSLSLSNSSYEEVNTFSLFNRALVIDIAEFEASSFIEGKICTAAVVFLFNMGLAHHLQGMQDIHSQETNFKKAMRLYKMGVEILDRCRRVSGETVNGLLYLASFNNMGHICSHFHRTKVVQRCLEWLNTILESMKRSNLDTLGDEYLPFHLNILILLGQDAWAASAA
jgi:hypothetical protein